ncbi:GerAB/ArcD/ProY family transporter [Paenibacillus sp. P36]|uniref:GerAB/ArcD/ProY family transporter n=1 Tax=Paenibacillus sp. P36 TaxID=3342538 RepID=UPI0038B3EC89
MMRSSPRVGAFQLYSLIVQSQFGSTAISIAHDVNAKSGTSGWISCLLGGAISLLFVYFVWKVSSQASNGNVFQLIMNRLGGWTGRLLLLIFSLLYALIAYIILSNWIYTTGLWAYQRTPQFFLLLCLIGLSVYLVIQPVTTYARFCVLSVCFIPIFIFLSMYTLKEWDIYNLLPLISASPFKIFDGAIVILWSLLGVEILLILPKYHQDLAPKKVLKIALLSYATTIGLYTFSTLSSLALFGTETISYIREPLLYQMKAISLNIIERMDLLIITIWILFVMTSFCTYFMLFVSSLSAMLKQKKEIPLVLTLICGFLLLLASMKRLTADQLDRFHLQVNYYVQGCSLGLILCVLLLLKIFPAKNGSEPS